MYKVKSNQLLFFGFIDRVDNANYPPRRVSNYWIIYCYQEKLHVNHFWELNDSITVDKTRYLVMLCYQCSATVSLETHPLHSMQFQWEIFYWHLPPILLVKFPINYLREWVRKWEGCSLRHQNTENSPTKFQWLKLFQTYSLAVTFLRENSD